MALSAYKFFKYTDVDKKDSKHTHTPQGNGTEEKGFEKRKVTKEDSKS